MRGSLHVSSNLGLTTGGQPGTFAVRAVVSNLSTYHNRGEAEAQRRADIVARAFEDALNAANIDVVQAYVRQNSSGTLTVLTAARILDRAGVRP